MPLSRVKTCDNCRSAKARCSREFPTCSRCAARGSSCTWQNHRSYRLRTRLLNKERSLEHESPSNSSSRDDQAAETRGGSLVGDWRPCSVGVDALNTNNDAPSTPTIHPDGIVPNIIDPFSSPMQYTPTETSSTAAVIADSVPHVTLQITSADQNQYLNYNQSSQPSSQILKQLSWTTLPLSTLSKGGPEGWKIHLKGLEAIGNTSPTQRQLFMICQRNACTLESYLICETLKGQIMSFISMMRDGKTLPPFIYPPCRFCDGPTDCPSAFNMAHDCLPEPLAVCTSILQMHATKSSKTAAFIWRTIYTEQQRLYKEHLQYDKNEFLAAIQASTFYIILLALEPAPVDNNFVQFLLWSTGEMASTLHNDDYIDSQPENPSHQREWAFHEATRRLFGLMFTINIILDVRIGNRAHIDCMGFDRLLLPSEKSLWEAQSDLAWPENRLLYFAEDWASALSIGTLRRSKGTTTTTAGSTGGLHWAEEPWVGRLARWCADLDMFGWFMWNASKVDINQKGAVVDR